MLPQKKAYNKRILRIGSKLSLSPLMNLAIKEVSMLHDNALRRVLLFPSPLPMALVWLRGDASQSKWSIRVLKPKLSTLLFSIGP